MATPDISTEDALSRDQIKSHLRAETQKLPPLLREVLVLRDLEELPIEQIAARLCISESAVKSRLSRARPMLRERMQRHIGRASLPATW